MTRIWLSAWQLFWLIAGLVVGTVVLVGAETIPAVLPRQNAADVFFQEYTKAVQSLRNGKRQDAAITMDVLQKNLTASPWHEIALLKSAELNETLNWPLAKEAYAELRQRLDNASYFQGAVDREQLFRKSIEGALDRGINRVRLRHIREALEKYRGQHARYPESLAQLSILEFIEREDIVDARSRPIRYTPTDMRLRRGPTFQNYQMDWIPPEPFEVKSPRINGTSQISDQPLKFTALIKVPGGGDARRVVENQTLEGFFIAAIAEKGAIVCTPDRVLVLPVAK